MQMSASSVFGGRQQVRVFILNDGENLESSLFRVQKGWVLQFRLGPSLFGKKVSVFVNHPIGPGQCFGRKVYYELEWTSDAKNSDDTASFANLPIFLAGSFRYYFTYQVRKQVEEKGSGYFIVDPVLIVGPSTEHLPLDCVQCQTVLTKCLGSFDEWEFRLQVSKRSGYNVIHFTPVQELGKSKSAYAICTQLTLSPEYSKEGAVRTMPDLEALVEKMRNEWKVISICDIVLNHTANESEWLQEHPESTYNCLNSPHLRPAYMLDTVLWYFSLEVAKGKWESSGIPPEINCELHLDSLRAALHGFCLPQVKLHEFYMVDVVDLTAEFTRLIVPPDPRKPHKDPEYNPSLEIIQDPQYRRLGCTIDMDLALSLYNIHRHECNNEEERRQVSIHLFEDRLNKLNHSKYCEIQVHSNSAVENVISAVRYERLQEGGPKIKVVSAQNPLVPQYLTHYNEETSLKNEEKMMYEPKKSQFMMAHNGWVIGDDPLKNFAEESSNVYLRRELICWGDSVKLRFGEKPDDSPFLWQHMKEYAEVTARTFHGVRLDNCHSTPIHVAEFILDAARAVRPDLYVVAELFTNSDVTDNVFANRLGINSLIREALSAWDSHEQGRLVYRYGGEPVGSFLQPPLRPLTPCIAHALFLDLTHDNPSPVEKRSVYDMLPSAALVAMACCGSGSTRGYDELVPHHVHVVNETRLYSSWSDKGDRIETVGDNKGWGNQGNGIDTVGYNTGILEAKKALNTLHYEMGATGFSQVYVDQVDRDIVTVTRHSPVTHESIILRAYTAFGQPDENFCRTDVPPLRVEGSIVEVVLEARLTNRNTKKSEGPNFIRPGSHPQHPSYITGLSDYCAELQEHFALKKSTMVQYEDSGDEKVVQIRFHNFQPGSVIAFRVKLHQSHQDAVTTTRTMITEIYRNPRELRSGMVQELRLLINRLTLGDLNRVLYRCDQEEKDDGKGWGVYDIPNFGPLNYCGLQGIVSMMATIKMGNDLGHPLCANLRDGNWLLEYTYGRLQQHISTENLGRWMQNNLMPLKAIPRYLIPCYFEAVVSAIYLCLLNRAWELFAPFVSEGSTFVQMLSLGSVQMGGYVCTAPLPKMAPGLKEPLPPLHMSDKWEQVESCVTLAAGLPHFSTGYMRNWGRDTFIALRGTMLLTWRFQEARFLILGFAAALRHGLIPNLLDRGVCARFNCRDAVWWWMWCIKCYVEMAPHGADILQDKVLRIFPNDDSGLEKNVSESALGSAASDMRGPVVQPLADVVQEAVQRHFHGVVFRERNAGTQIDAHMCDEGFNNSVGVDLNTGFVYGGNIHNAGTWMDKMGSSDKAGNKGKPATPRDGSAVELVALCHQAVKWLGEMHSKGLYSYSGVERLEAEERVKWTFKEWEAKIKDNFEKMFWIASEPGTPGEEKTELIHRRGIYKDSIGASQPWADFQLRCNFPVAMALSPELFDPSHAWTALNQAQSLLMGPLGMRTLDPADWCYNGHYDNSDDGYDPATAHGFNYHQGPEWVWPMGYFLLAKLRMSRNQDDATREATISTVKSVLAKHFTEVQRSPWRGLPELTNKSGEFCWGSCATQAWSMGCVLEVLYEMNHMEQNSAGRK